MPRWPTCWPGPPADRSASRAIGKPALYHQLALGQDDAYAYAVPVMAEAGVIPDAQEGMRAFVEKRPPEFGRT